MEEVSGSKAAISAQDEPCALALEADAAPSSGHISCALPAVDEDSEHIHEDAAWDRSTWHASPGSVAPTQPKDNDSFTAGGTSSSSNRNSIGRTILQAFSLSKGKDFKPDPQSEREPRPYERTSAEGLAPKKKPLLERLSLGAFGSSAPAANAGHSLPSGTAAPSQKKQPLLQRLSLGAFASSPHTPTPSDAASSSKGSKRGGGLPPKPPSGNNSPRTKNQSPQGKQGSKQATSNQDRPLGSNSTPIVHAYDEQEGPTSRGQPNLRRRGCYSGLVGAYRTGNTDKGGHETEEGQLLELKEWLHDTTQPWKAHSSRLLRMQAAEMMKQQEEKAAQPPVPPHQQPLAPPRRKLKTFSMASPATKKD